MQTREFPADSDKGSEKEFDLVAVCVALHTGITQRDGKGFALHARGYEAFIED
jgi:hypothetical protein